MRFDFPFTRHAGRAVAAGGMIVALAACQGTPTSEVWRFRCENAPQIKAPQDTAATIVALVSGDLRLLLSGQSGRDSTAFAVVSGLSRRIAASDSLPRQRTEVVEELTPGHGMRWKLVGQPDSIWFEAGDLRFEGTCNDVYASGKVYAAKKGRRGEDGAWVMALKARERGPTSGGSGG